MSKGAGEALQEAAAGALQSLSGLNGIHEGAPVQAAIPYALVDASFETDWSTKSGSGREVLLAVTIRDEGEQPKRLRTLAAKAEGAIAGMEGSADGWRIVTLRFLRSRIVSIRSGEWASVSEYRARMLTAE